MRSHWRLLTAMLIGVAFLALSLWMATRLPQPVRAGGPWYVAPGGNDSNDCLSPSTPCATINAAIGTASSSDTIYVATGTYTTSTGSEVVLIDKSVTVSGGWDEGFATQSEMSTIDGEDVRRGITISGTVTVWIEGFVIENGRVTGSSRGGGIHNASGNVNLYNLLVRHNAAELSGGGIASSGRMTVTQVVVEGNSAEATAGIFNGWTSPSVMTLISSTVTNNTATGSDCGGLFSGRLLLLLDSEVSGNVAGGWGGGIEIPGWGTGELVRSTVSGNSAVFGGGIYNNSGGTLSLIDSAVTSNTAQVDGGGIRSRGAALLVNSEISGNAAENGGGISNNWRATSIISSTISGNSATRYGGGIYNEALNGPTCTVAVTSSTISGNSAGWGGGGIHNYGGLFGTCTVTVTNSTVSGNMAGSYGGAGIYNEGTAGLFNSTIASNTTQGYGGGIRGQSGSTTRQRNTLLARNSTSSQGPDCRGIISSLGYNLVEDTSGCTFSSSVGDLLDIDAEVGPLEGSPGYHPLLPGSPAINAGDPAGCANHLGNLLATDQRGAPRIGRCDIGAYEAGLVATKQVNGAFWPGESVTYIIILNNRGGTVDLSDVSLVDTLPISLTYVAGSFSASTGTGGGNNQVITWTGTVLADTDTVVSFGATVSAEAPLCAIIANNTAVVNDGGSYEFECQVAGATPCRVCNLTRHASNPVLSVGVGGSWDDSHVWGPAVLKQGGLYRMWYTGDDGSSPWKIGMATSIDGFNWTKDIANNPVLSPTQPWEANGVWASTVMSDSGHYRMWYTGYDDNSVRRIGYATSTNGVSWAKYGGNPVLGVGTSETWEDEDVSWPTVVKDGSTYHMWYTGYDGMTFRIGHATSSDGITWTRDVANPVLDVGSLGDWDSQDVYGPSVVAHNDAHLMWYSGDTLPPAWQTGYAVSFGSDWSRKGALLLEGAPGTFDVNSADYPSVILDGDEFKVWYSGLNDANTYTIGYATAQICSTSDMNRVYLPIVMGGGGQPLCPVYYSDDFSDPTSGWPEWEDSDVKFAYTGGQYQIWVKQPSQGWLVTRGVKATDFTAAVSARRTTGSSGRYGIVFGINEDWSDYYEVLVEGDSYIIRRQTGESSNQWNGTSRYINGATGWNRLKVIRSGSRISLYVNDHHVRTVTDSSITGLGRIGLAVHTPETRAVDTRFDDFALYPADCGVSAAAMGSRFEMGRPGIHRVPVSLEFTEPQ